MKNDTEKRTVSQRTARVVAAALIGAMALGGAAYAWLAQERTIAAVALIDSPMSIMINAANREDIQYLDLSGINIEEKDGNGNRYNQKDFAFTVEGEGITSFKLQLAYTTNNQFEFEIYQAVEVGSGGSPDVTYEGLTTHYYKIDGSMLAMSPLNDTDNNKVANGADTYSAKTYQVTAVTPVPDFTAVNGIDPNVRFGEDDDGVSSANQYAHIDQYAVPIYRQTDAAIPIQNKGVSGGGDSFYNYFILRVKWSPDKTNDRETDMLYIAAKQA